MSRTTSRFLKFAAISSAATFLTTVAPLALAAFTNPLSGVSAPVTTLTGDAGVVGLFCAIASWWLMLTILLSIVYGIWAGWRYVTGEGEEKKNTEARRMIQYAMIGVAIGIVALGVPQVVGSFFGMGDKVKGCSFGVSLPGS